MDIIVFNALAWRWRWTLWRSALMRCSPRLNPALAQ